MIISMKRIGFLLLLPLVLVFSCGTEPASNAPAKTPRPVLVEPESPAEPLPSPEPASEPALPPEPGPTPESPPEIVKIAPPPEPEPEPPPVLPPEPAPEPPPEIAATVPPEPEPEPPPAEEVFDPATITEERFETTRADVQTLIGDLNRIIRAKNYNAWVAYLSPSYMETISSGDFLRGRTEDLYKRDQIVASNLGRDPRRVEKKILRTARDYFNNVVVPSRSNDRMDDIDFISENRVKAYTVDNRGQRLVLYDLEMIDNEWKIIN